jgi:hypothetical protein
MEAREVMVFQKKFEIKTIFQFAPFVALPLHRGLVVYS